MRRFVLIAALSMSVPTLVSAQTFHGCTKVEQGQFSAAADRAERLSVTATTAISPNPTFDRWFGRHSAKSAETVRRNLKAVVKALRSERVEVTCKNNGQGICDEETFAFVNRDRPFVINLCPRFFVMDTMKQLTPESAVSGHGTRAGTLIHELTHFNEVAGTSDICYSRSDCTEMAIQSPEDALLNADSYQYFAEDVAFFGVSGAPESIE